MNDAHGVRVTLTQAFPTPLIPFFTSGNRVMVASATAEQAALGSFYLGSGLLSVDAGILNALLSGLLGGNVTLDAVSYKQLASVSVRSEEHTSELQSLMRISYAVFCLIK